MGVKPVMVLFGGERDGWDTEIDPAYRPDVYYVVPHEDQNKIDACKSSVAKREMCDRLAVLAYEFDPEQSTLTRFVMVRRPQRDRVTHP
jgi:hypothetical protein